MEMRMMMVKIMRVGANFTLFYQNKCDFCTNQAQLSLDMSKLVKENHIRNYPHHSINFLFKGIHKQICTFLVKSGLNVVKSFILISLRGIN